MRTIWKLLRLLWSASRWQLVYAVALSSLLSLAEGVSIAMVFPLIVLLGDGTGSPQAAGPHTRRLFELLSATHLPRTAWLPVLLIVVMLSVGMLTQFNSLLSNLSFNVVVPLRAKLAADIFEAALGADWTFLTRRRSSELTHLLTGEVSRVQVMSSSVVALLANGMVGALMLGLAFYLAPWLTLLLLASLGLILPWQRRLSRAIYASGGEISDRSRKVFDSSVERLQNLKVVKAFGAQDAELRLFRSRYDAVLDELMENQWRATSSSRSFQLGSLAVLCGLVLLGMYGMHLSGATVLIFLVAMMRATPRMNVLQAKVNEIAAEAPAFEEIERFIADCAENAEARFDDGMEKAPALKQAITLERVSFAYIAGGARVLDDLTIALLKGRVTAIAGLSGAGKSTVADMVMGLLLPDEGTVNVDGVAITRDNARAWRRRIGYVSQDTLLFHDSIRANLLWAKPGATEEDLVEALEAASAEFVFGLARGLETPVGDRGMMLSHGQRQRIALARALLLKPELLILDEATNSLDLQNEETILRTVRRAGCDLTTLLISHRPSALQIADQVYVLAGGKLETEGR